MDTLLSFVREDLLPFLTEIGNTIRGVPNEVRKMESELQRIQAFIHRADRLVAAEKEKDKQDEIKKKVKLLAEAAFLIEDVIDDYKIYKELQSRHRGCAALPCRVAAYLIRRHQIAHNIQSIKSQVSEIKESSNRDNDFFFQFSLEQGASSSTGNQEVTWLSLREAPLYMNEADIVGFGAPKDELIGWLVKGRAERTVISVVGMGGLGKTTLAKKVFDNHEVIGHFDCRVWVTVSQTYTLEGLLRDVLKALHKGSPPQNLSTMDRRSLIDEVRNYLDQKRYFILFDDVWNANFWDEISFALIDKKNQSRILITTRNMPVAECCMKSSFVEIHELQPLSEAESWELFCKKAFQFESDGCCPQELQDISSEIVKKCRGLPLAIVAIGGLLSSKQKTRLEWEEFHRNLNLELDKNPDLADITKILGFSYNDLPYHLKSCFLHFGIYPEDYDIEVEELIHQWVAEGFAKDKPSEKRVAEEVAEQYIRELIGRSLVQVSSITIDGKAGQCHVHDMLREMILRKFEDLSFCHVISSEDNEPALDGIIRRLSIAPDSNSTVLGSIESQHLRSLYAFTDKPLPEDFVMNIPNKYRLLKVLHFGMISDVLNVPEILGNLIHLKYLRFWVTRITSFPESIGNLENLETLDLMYIPRWEGVNVPKEITKLRKLRHLYVDSMYWIEGIGGMASLQTLRTVIIRGDEQVRELEKLHQLRTLTVSFEGRSTEGSVSFSIEQMKHLETLVILAYCYLQLNCISPPRKLQELHILGRLYELPEWFLKLQNLVVLKLSFSRLSEDPLPSLKNMSSLLDLTLETYNGETLHFQDGWFQKLKRLEIQYLPELNSIIIDGGALHSLQSLHLRNIPQLEMVPVGIQHLKNLQVLVVLTLHWSKLSEDPLPSLKNMSSLLALTLEDHDYIGETMHFQDGWFQKLKRLELIHFSNLNSIIIDGGALHSLQSLHLRSIPQLKTVPAGIQHLQNLRVLECESMSHEFKERISANGGQDRWIVDHVPLVLE